jgi:Protein of unknown function (DUF3365)
MRLTARLPLLLLPALLLGAAPAQSDDEAMVEQARAAVTAFSATLKQELTDAMEAGGTQSAIKICNSSAPGIAQKVSLEQGMTLTRVSERYRNPNNAPNAWQSEVLDSFATLLADGAPIDSLEWNEVVGIDGGKEFRYMKAIPTGTLCLACHGTNLRSEVVDTIAELYPGDLATDFSVGDLRGAFVVTRRIP